MEKRMKDHCRNTEGAYLPLVAISHMFEWRPLSLLYTATKAAVIYQFVNSNKKIAFF